MKAWTQEVTAKYPVTDVFGDKRQELNEALDKYLKKKFEPYGIIIDTVNFTSISTDDETQAAIQKKVNAQQELELANIEAKTAKVQADKDKEVALIAAEQDKEKAAIEVKLWDEYLIFAAVLGIADRVEKQLKVAIPRYEETSTCNNFPIYYYTHTFAHNSMSAASSAASAGQGGSSSFSGGGGGFSGGGGGGVR